MKKIFSILVVVLLALAPLSALAVSYAGEEMVVQQSTCSKPVAQGATAAEVKAQADRVLRGIKSSEVSVKSDLGKINRSLMDNNESVLKMVDGIGSLDRRVAENTNAMGVVATKVDGTNAEVKDLKGSLGLWALVIVGFITAIVVIVLILIARTRSKKDLDVISAVRGLDGKLDAINTKIDEVPEKTAEVVKELEGPFTLTDVGVAKKKFWFKPILKDGKRLTLRVPESATGTFADPEEIPRVPASKVTSMKKDNAKVLTEWVDGKIAKGSLQYMVVEHAITTSELKEI